MRQTAARLLQLIALLQARRFWSGAELAERMAVDRRSIRRDVERLRQLGYPIQASSGVGGGYRMGAGAPALPLMFEEEEAVTMALALRAAAASVGGIEETAHRLLTKLDPLVPTRLRQHTGQVHAATATLADLPATDARLLGQLARACRDVTRLEFAYRTSAGEASHRQADVHHLVNYGRRWYLVAWDLVRENWRTYRVDRIESVQPERTPGIRRRTPEPPEAMVRRAVSQSPFAHQLVIRLQGALEQVGAGIPPWCGVLEAEGPTHCLLTLGADSPAMLASLMLTLEMDFELVRASSPALRPQIQATLETLQARLGRDLQHGTHASC
ncbi:MAG: WYL domain-containing protein [Pseudoxanthomonas sp.]